MLEIGLIAIGLSMDAFAVSIGLGLSAKDMKPGETFIPGLYFGFFQALMPAIGYFAGVYFAGKILFLDHWITFVLLGFIGGKMIKDSFSKKEDAKNAGYSFKFSKMLVLAIATSIDALAVGVTFSFFRIPIAKAVLITGFTTLVISTFGVKAGRVFGTKYQSKAELAGGAVLVIIGLKILIEHLLYNK